uniref:NR LBD domain-containing protein n=1 Tax=Panagrellus redivivus TaxID=6233 RepID=A0A7E4W0F3_PANRE
MDASAYALQIRVSHSRYNMKDYFDGQLRLTALASRINSKCPTLNIYEELSSAFILDGAHSDYGLAILMYTTANCATAMEFPRLRATLMEIYDVIVLKLTRCFLKKNKHPEQWEGTTIETLLECYVTTTDPKHQMAGVRHILMAFIFLLRSPRAEWILTTKYDEICKIRDILKDMHAVYRQDIADGKTVSINEFIKNMNKYETDVLDSA